MIDLDSVPSSTLLSAALSRISSADASILRSLGVSKAVFIEVPLAFGRMGELGRMLSLARADPALIHAELAVHESFHLFAQFPNWFGSPQAYAWPAWDRQPDRRQLRERCYQLTPEMTSALNAEIAELLSAFDVLLGAVVDTAAALTHARQFVALRSGRHAALDTVRITQGDRLIGCREAEDLMEMEEGVPQWLGHATAVRAGLRDRERYRASYAGQQPDAFYRSGPLMLWVLQGLLGESALHDLTARMSRSSSGREGAPYSVFVGAAGR